MLERNYCNKWHRHNKVVLSDTFVVGTYNEGDESARSTLQHEASIMQMFSTHSHRLVWQYMDLATAYGADVARQIIDDGVEREEREEGVEGEGGQHDQGAFCGCDRGGVGGSGR